MRDVLQKILNRLRGLKQLEAQEIISERAYMEDSKGNVRVVAPEAVDSAAALLEATLAMTEKVHEDQPITLTMTKLELASFVCYMRQLDSAYREQGKFVAKHIKPAESPGEFKTVEEAAEVSPAVYERLTGQAASPRPHRSGRQFAQVDERHV